MKLLEYGNTPVPQTTEWGREAGYFIAPCLYAGGRLAFCQHTKQNEPGDRPAYGRQHFGRQRRAAVLGLCDLCARPLRGATKISLSRHLVSVHPVIQLEPLLHRECAVISMGACPDLRKGVAAGNLVVRRVTRWRPLLDTVAPHFVSEQVPDWGGGREPG